MLFGGVQNCQKLTGRLETGGSHLSKRRNGALEIGGAQVSLRFEALATPGAMSEGERDRILKLLSSHLCPLQLCPRLRKKRDVQGETGGWGGGRLLGWPLVDKVGDKAWKKVGMARVRTQAIL